MTVVYLGLGANLGDREEMLARAAARLDAHPAIRVLRRSSLYETEPVGPAGQPWYLNAVLEAETSLSPLELLGTCKQIEAELGRKRGVRWGPRPIDIDVLLFGHFQISTPDLVVPHPELRKRAFVLVPLAEIAPDLVLPGGETVKAVLAGLHDPHRVNLYRKVWPRAGEPAPEC